MAQTTDNVPPMPRALLIRNFLLFQLGWIGCVLCGANHLPLVGSLLAAGIIALHIWQAEIPGAEMRLVLAAVLIGMTFESLLTLTGLSHYPSGILREGFAPYWMVMMWGLFATTLNVSMRWMKSLPMPLLILSGMTLAPLSYLAGQRLQAVTFPDTITTLLWIAGGWAVLFPLLLFIANKNNGYAHPEAAMTNNDHRSYTHV